MHIRNKKIIGYLLKKKGGISCERTLDELSWPSGISLGLVDVPSWSSDLTYVLVFVAKDCRWLDGSIAAKNKELLTHMLKVQLDEKF